MRVYGAPFDRQVQLNRQLRRGRPGLIRGRSEAVAPVRLGVGMSGRKLSVGADGDPGAPGPEGTARLSRGMRLWARPMPWPTVIPAGFGMARWLVDFGFSASSSALAGVIAVPPTNDINALPRAIRETNSASAGSIAAITTGALDFSHAVGFSIVCQFAFTTLTAGGRWFVGLAEGITTPDPSGGTGLLGVGQDAADAAPMFMHSTNFPSGGTVKSTTGLPVVVVNTVYEVRLFWSPHAVGAQMSFEVFSGGVSAGLAAYDTDASTDVPAGSRQFSFVWANGTGVGLNRIAILGFYAELHPGDVL